MVETIRETIDRIQKEKKFMGRVGKKVQEERVKESRAKAKKWASRISRVGRFVTPSGSRPRISRKTSARVGRGVQGLMSAILPSQVMEGVTPYAVPGEKKKYRGRGRPRKTYKTRYVPGVGAVKVPTHIYRKMMSESKARSRLAAAQQQARFQEQMEAEQIAMVQRQTYEQPDAFLESPDMDHEQRLAEFRQRQAVQQMPQQGLPGRLIRGAGTMFRKLGTQMARPGMILPAQRQMAGYQQQMYPQEFPSAQQQIRPQLSILGKSSILNAPNIFNRPGNSIIGFNGRGGY